MKRQLDLHKSELKLLKRYKNKLEGIEKYNKEIETIKSSIKINELKAIELGSTDYNNQEDLDKAKEQLKNLFIENQSLQNKGLEIFNEIGDSKESLTKNAEILDVLKETIVRLR